MTSLPEPTQKDHAVKVSRNEEKRRKRQHPDGPFWVKLNNAGPDRNKRPVSAPKRRGRR